MAHQLGDVAVIVPHEPRHMGFVFDNWLNDWRTSKHAGVVRNCDYYEVTRTVIEDLIGRGARISIAEDPSGAFLGFVCYETKDGKAVVHYLYVKDPFLRQGVEERLISSVGTPGWFTFFHPDLAKDKRWRHAPEIARRRNL